MPVAEVHRIEDARDGGDDRRQQEGAAHHALEIDQSRLILRRLLVVAVNRLELVLTQEHDLLRQLLVERALCLVDEAEQPLHRGHQPLHRDQLARSAQDFADLDGERLEGVHLTGEVGRGIGGDPVGLGVEPDDRLS